MQGTKVILGTYNAMPDGASGKVFELTYQRSWRPFLSSLYKFQNINAVLYYSGVVFQWIEENHPEFLLLLEEMAGRKQIELLGGGYFSPLFPMLQPSDKIGQIEMLTTYLRKTFGKRPSGGWLGEYAWDDAIPVVFRNSGLTYTFLPATLLAGAGLSEDGQFPPLITEDQRKLLYVFPTFDIDATFGQAMPFEMALERLMAIYPDCRLYSMMIDGNSIPAMWEASGLESPDVMFEKTFAWFQKNCLETETILAQSYSRTLKSGKLFYLCSCMAPRLEASLGTADQVTGTIQRAPVKQLLLRNGASKHLYDKMYHIHSLMSLLRGDKARKKSAQEDLWKAQNGDAYWESAVGGIRRPEVRMNAFRALIEAEKATRIHGSFSSGIILDDIDCDGEKEIVYQAADMNCYIHLKGASVFELDSFKTKQNYCCTYAPFRNGDGSGPAAEGAASAWRGANSFVDRIFSAGAFDEELISLGNQSYSLLDHERSPSKVIFSKDFAIKAGGALYPMSLRKAYLFQKYCVSVDIEISNRSQYPISLRHAIELNLQPAAEWSEIEFLIAGKNREKEKLPSLVRMPPVDAEALFIQSTQKKELLELRSDKTFSLRAEHSIDRLATPPILRLQAGQLETAPSGPAGETLYQGTKLLFGWDLDLSPDTSASIALSLHF
jgi:alpha-amylase